MSRKGGVVKTYGRHKFRIVKSQIWLSPNDDLNSPAVKDDERPPFNLNRKAVHSIPTNFKPKTSDWSKPSCSTSNPRRKKQTSLRTSSNESNKENINSSTLSPNENVLPKTTKYSLFGNCTPLISQRLRNVSATRKSEDPSWLEDSLVLVNDTQENAVEQCSRVVEVVCVEDSDGQSSSNSDGPLVDSNRFACHSHGSTQESSFVLTTKIPAECKLSGVLPDVSCGSRRSTDIQDLSSRGKGQSLLHRDDFDSAFKRNMSLQVTSTPLFTQDSSTTSGYRSDSQTSFLMDDRDTSKPENITPIQHERRLISADTTNSEDTNKDVSGNLNSLTANEFASPPNKLRKPESLQERKTHCKHPSNHSTLMLKECVVSLKQLRLTPLLSSKQIRKVCSVASMKSKTFESNPNVRRSQLSFVEALTPVKKTRPTPTNDYQEEVELNAFEKVLLECGQEKLVGFSEFLDRSMIKNITKIGEGVYGEVFRGEDKTGNSIALKIIPVEGDFPVNGEAQKSFEEILPEIVISKELSLLGDANKQEQTVLENMTTSFIRVFSVTCCQGQYPSNLITEWDKWNRENSSENERPDIFPCGQHFIVFSFSNGGRDLESFEFHVQSEAWSVLQQTALGLAVAENALEFEHRDLHWGNILICKTESDFIEGRMLGETIKVQSHGVQASLIDFTLSRLTQDGVTVFCNLAEDKSLFTSKGDYQFDIYRLMKKSNQNEWEPFNPYTNVLWLHYLADKMLKKKNYHIKNKETEANLRKFLRRARKCSSATEIVQEFFD